MNSIAGRKEEQVLLREALQTDRSELIVLYGRRRVGKTFLVRKVLEQELCFDMSGSINTTMPIQLANFARQLGQYMATGIPPATPANWADAFHMLQTYLSGIRKTSKKVLFFDELPWLDSMHSGFLAALDYFWNNWCTKRTDIVVVVCGSAASWMIKKILRNKGGLHNRVTRKIRLFPFTLAETREFLQLRHIDLNPHQIAQLYMALGGVPFYLDALKRGKSAAQNIDDLCFAKNGLLRHEFDELYTSLYANAERHISIIRALAKKTTGLTRSELAEAAGLSSGGYLSTVLAELEESGFISAYALPRRKTKDTLYKLSDEYSLFYLRFIEPRPHADAGAWLSISKTAQWKAWSGFAFETLCMRHIQKIKDALQIGGVYTEQYAWHSRSAGVQIDLLIHRADGCINLCEIKFAQGTYAITAATAKDIQQKVLAYRNATGSQQTIFSTWITTAGVEPNKWYAQCVDAEVKLDQLF